MTSLSVPRTRYNKRSCSGRGSAPAMDALASLKAPEVSASASSMGSKRQRCASAYLYPYINPDYSGINTALPDHQCPLRKGNTYLSQVFPGSGELEDTYQFRGSKSSSTLVKPLRILSFRIFPDRP